MGQRTSWNAIHCSRLRLRIANSPIWRNESISRNTLNFVLLLIGNHQPNRLYKICNWSIFHSNKSKSERDCWCLYWKIFAATVLHIETLWVCIILMHTHFTAYQQNILFISLLDWIRFLVQLILASSAVLCFHTYLIMTVLF